MTIYSVAYSDVICALSGLTRGQLVRRIEEGYENV